MMKVEFQGPFFRVVALVTAIVFLPVVGCSAPPLRAGPSGRLLVTVFGDKISTYSMQDLTRPVATAQCDACEEAVLVNPSMVAIPMFLNLEFFTLPDLKMVRSVRKADPISDLAADSQGDVYFAFLKGKAGFLGPTMRSIQETTHIVKAVSIAASTTGDIAVAGESGLGIYRPRFELPIVSYKEPMLAVGFDRTGELYAFGRESNVLNSYAPVTYAHLNSSKSIADSDSAHIFPGRGNTSYLALTRCAGRSEILSIDGTTGLLSHRANIDGRIRSIAVAPDGGLYVGSTVCEADSLASSVAYIPADSDREAGAFYAFNIVSVLVVP